MIFRTTMTVGFLCLLQIPSSAQNERERAAAAKQQDRGAGKYHGLFHHLEASIDALRKLGRAEQAEKLSSWAREMRADLEARERGDAAKKGAKPAGGDHAKREGAPKKLTEREAAEQQVATMKYAAGVLNKAGQEEAAKSLEHAAHALRLRLDGRRGEEAQQVTRSAPSRRANSIHLRMAAEVLAKQGDREHAEFVANMANRFAAADERARRRSREVPARAGVSARGSSDRRIRDLERRVEQLARTLQEVQRELARRRRF